MRAARDTLGRNYSLGVRPISHNVIYFRNNFYDKMARARARRVVVTHGDNNVSRRPRTTALLFSTAAAKRRGRENVLEIRP